MWLTFSPIPDLTASFYHISVDDVDWFSNSYSVVSFTIGFFSIWVLDTFGLGTAVSTDIANFMVLAKEKLLAGRLLVAAQLDYNPVVYIAPDYSIGIITSYE